MKNAVVSVNQTVMSVKKESVSVVLQMMCVKRKKCVKHVVSIHKHLSAHGRKPMDLGREHVMLQQT